MNNSPNVSARPLLVVALAVVVVVATLNVVTVEGGIPIPLRQLGFVYRGGAEGQGGDVVHLDFYISPTCPDSRDAFPVIMQLAELYGPERLRLTTRLFPLPYHRAAFLASKVAHVVDDISDGNSTHAWFKHLFDGMDPFTTSATNTINEDTLLQNLARLAAEVVPGSEDRIQQQVKDNSTVEVATRVGFKYASSRGVVETPTFMVNDVLVGATPAWTLQQWRDLIDPLLEPSRVPEKVHTILWYRKQFVCKFRPLRVHDSGGPFEPLPPSGWRCLSHTYCYIISTPTAQQFKETASLVHA